MTESHVRATTDAGVTTILLDRVAKKNALDGAMYAGLTRALEAAGDDPAVRVVVITGGSTVFTAGNDLGDFARIREGGSDLAAATFLRTLTQYPKPIVAAVSGWAIGIGTTMLLHCDFVYAAPSARFKTPFVDLGLCPEAASSVLLAETVGPRRAAEMLLLGRELGAEEAREAGLVTALVEDPGAHAAQVALELARRAPGAMRATKALMRRASRARVEDAMTAELAVFVERLSSEEAVEAAMAMMARRPADFSRFR